MGGHSQKWACLFSSRDRKICCILRMSLWIGLLFCMLTVMQWFLVKPTSYYESFTFKCWSTAVVLDLSYIQSHNKDWLTDTMIQFQANTNKYFIGLLALAGGPINLGLSILLSVCLSVCPSFHLSRSFLETYPIVFFIFGMGLGVPMWGCAWKN